MADALATVEQFEIRLGRKLLDEERDRVQAILEDTSAIAVATAGADWTPATVPGDVQAVVLSAALRTFKNPDRYVQQAIGDYSARIDSSEFAAGLFSKAELDILKRNTVDALSFGSFGTLEVERGEVVDRGARFWGTNRPGLATPWSEDPVW